MSHQNSSVIQCPECGKSLVGIGYKVARIHPIPRWLEKNGYQTFCWWALISPFLLYAWTFNSPILERGLAFGWFGMVSIGGIILYFIPRFFNAYRVIDCPYCGFHEEVKLGKVQNV